MKTKKNNAKKVVNYASACNVSRSNYVPAKYDNRVSPFASTFEGRLRVK